MSRTVSLCMIVRDEADQLTACVESAREAVDEIIIVDTGSTDGTVELAERLGAKVSHFTWCDDFAAARNASLDAATSDFVLVLDADERLQDPTAVRRLVDAEDESAPATVYLPLIVNLDAEGNDLGADHMPRLWRRRPTLRFSGRIHEQVGVGLDSVRRAYQDELRILHYGYDPAMAAARGKHDRNRRLLKVELGERPDDPSLLYYLAKQHYASGEDDAALALFLRVVEDGTALNLALSSRLFAGECLRTQGRSAEALVLANAGLDEHPTYGALWYVAGQAALDIDDPETALAAFERAKNPAQGIAALAFADPSIIAWRADLGRARALLFTGNVEAGTAVLTGLPPAAVGGATSFLLSVAQVFTEGGDMEGAARVLEIVKNVGIG
jgi:tetratricopeptide (TPR) repeat protein